LHFHAHSSASWKVKAALALTLALVAVEFISGTFAHSLALLSDGWHNLSDVPTLALSWLALYFERRPPDERKTYGYQRAGVLAAFVNALILVAVAIFVGYEGYERIVHPSSVGTLTMLVVGVVALVTNGGITFALAGHRRDLNLRAVFIHNLGDALSNLGIIAGAWLIRMTGQTLIDPLIAFLIAGLILWSTVEIFADSANILLESLPRGMKLEAVAAAILEVEGVREVHDVHIWSLGPETRALSCHVLILDMATSETEPIAHRIRKRLAEGFDIHHSTIQFEHTHPAGDFHRYMPEPAPTAKKD
jgi:cobalt-zinc-cadmium efflux system protein